MRSMSLTRQVEHAVPQAVMYPTVVTIYSLMLLQFYAAKFADFGLLKLLFSQALLSQF